MSDWPHAKIENPKLQRKLPVQLGMQATAPDNAIRMYAGALAGNSKAHTIKNDYDTNNPTPPAARKK